ncbi:hypothetical protein G9A89_000142 [Geosiphon pyriformis]|nr:hypothetical protein G9A89_000142 [Geosiphon pyriformis]
MRNNPNPGNLPEHPIITKIKAGWQKVAGVWRSITGYVFKPASPKIYPVKDRRKFKFVSDMARYAQSAYTDDPDKTLIAPGVWANIFIAPTPLNTQYGPKPAIISTFRGRSLTQKTMASLLQNSQFDLYPHDAKPPIIPEFNIPIINIPFKLTGNQPLVNDEFYQNRFVGAEATLWQVYEQYLKARASLGRYKYRDHFYVFTGHGEGGVFAIFAALALRVKWRFLKIVVVTFGEPRIGNEAFARFVDSKIEVWRITYGDDHVPLYFKNEYVHEMMEFYIPSQPSCDCVENDPSKIPETFLMCQSTGYGIESPDCINRFDRKVPEESTAHWGPYFGYFMTRDGRPPTLIGT